MKVMVAFVTVCMPELFSMTAQIVVAFSCSLKVTVAESFESAFSAVPPFTRPTAVGAGCVGVNVKTRLVCAPWVAWAK